jgi:uncharacterized protein YkwD
MLRKLLVPCATLLLLHATAGAEQESGPESGAVAPAPTSAPLCIKSSTLEQVAQELANLQDIPPSSELIRTARVAGVDANPIYAKFGVTGEFASFKAWVEDLKETADAPLICGRAQSGERIVLVAAVRAGALTLEGGNRLHVETISEFREPFLVVRDSRGTSRRIAVDAGDGASVTLPPEWGRPLFVQLVATGPNGLRPIAERWVGKVPKQAPTPHRSQSPEAWLLQLRRSAGSRSLRSNRLLSQEATRYANVVCEAGKVGHELDPTGDPEARLLRRGIEARVVGEAVARAATLSDALRVIEDSPSHRMTVTDPRFTDAGYGQAKDDKGRTCAVILLASWPRKIR